MWQPPCSGGCLDTEFNLHGLSIDVQGLCCLFITAYLSSFLTPVLLFEKKNALNKRLPWTPNKRQQFLTGVKRDEAQSPCSTSPFYGGQLCLGFPDLGPWSLLSAWKNNQEWSTQGRFQGNKTRVHDSSLASLFLIFLIFFIVLYP
jgi:hypothetical protein